MPIYKQGDHLSHLSLEEKGKRLCEAVKLSQTSLLHDLLQDPQNDQFIDAMVPDQWGWKKTALMFAAERNQAKLIPLLLDAGASINQANDTGTTALIFAARHNAPQALQALIHAGANLNRQDREGYTALMLAAWNEYTECAQMLLAAGADPRPVNYKGKKACTLTPYGKKALRNLLASAEQEWWGVRDRETLAEHSPLFTWTKRLLPPDAVSLKLER